MKSVKPRKGNEMACAKIKIIESVSAAAKSGGESGAERHGGKTALAYQRSRASIKSRAQSSVKKYDGKKKKKKSG